MGNTRNFIAIRNDFFEKGNPWDQIMQHEDGAKNSIIFLELCTLSADADGFVGRKEGDEIIPLTYAEIAAVDGYNDEESVMKAMNLFEDLGFIKLDHDTGLYRISIAGELFYYGAE